MRRRLTRYRSRPQRSISQNVLSIYFHKREAYESDPAQLLYKLLLLSLARARECRGAGTEFSHEAKLIA